MQVVVTGGAGLIGSHLCRALRAEGHQVIAVGPHPPLEKEQGIDFIQANLINGQIPSIFAECDTIIHLAGANIFHRWTKNYKQIILKSRIQTAEAIYDFLSKQGRRPHSFISASAVGFYGDRGEEMLDETSLHGEGFLASVCVEWERASKRFSSLGMRTACLRTGAVLSREGGFLSKTIPMFRWGLGGKLGKGTQWFPWIHIDDLIHIYLKAIYDSHFTGSINAVAPGLIRNIEFTHALGSNLKKPTYLSLPSPFLKLIFGEFATVLLSSQRVTPSVLEKWGFSFAYPTIQQAINE